MAVPTGELKQGESLRLRRDGDIVGYFSGGDSRGAGITHGEALADFADMHGLDWRDYDLRDRELVLISDRAQELFAGLEFDVVLWEDAPFQGLANYPGVTDTATVARWVAAADARAHGREPPDHLPPETIRRVDLAENFELGPDQALEILAADGTVVGYFGGDKEAGTLALALDQYADKILPPGAWTAAWKEPFEPRSPDVANHMAGLTLNLVRDPPFRGFSEAPTPLVLPETILQRSVSDEPVMPDTAAQALRAFADFMPETSDAPELPEARQPEPAPEASEPAPVAANSAALKAFANFGNAPSDDIEDPFASLPHDIGAAPQTVPQAATASAQVAAPTAVAAPPPPEPSNAFGQPHTRPSAPISTAKAPAPEAAAGQPRFPDQPPQAAGQGGAPASGGGEAGSIAYAAAAAAGQLARTLFSAGSNLITGLGHGLSRPGTTRHSLGPAANQQMADAQIATDLAVRSAARFAALEPVETFHKALDAVAHQNALPKARIMAEMNSNPEYMHLGQLWREAVAQPEIASAHESLLQQIAVHQAKWDAATDGVRTADGDHDRLWEAAEGANRALEEPLKTIPGRDGRSLGDALREWFDDLSLKIRQFFSLGPASETRPAP